MNTIDVTSAVENALAAVDDPEYPGISIVDLGLVERVTVDGPTVDVGLIPTFSGCPALALIADDVERAVASVPGVESVSVVWLATPSWTVERMTSKARERLAREFTVAVALGGDAKCPRCGSPTKEQSMFGPSRCRAVHVCPSCSEAVEVMRS